HGRALFPPEFRQDGKMIGREFAVETVAEQSPAAYQEMVGYENMVNHFRIHEISTESVKAPIMGIGIARQVVAVAQDTGAVQAPVPGAGPAAIEIPGQDQGPVASNRGDPLQNQFA